MSAATQKKTQSVLEQKKLVLTKAFIRMSEKLNLERNELSDILGISEATLSRMFNQNQTSLIDPFSKSGEIALLMIRLYKNLSALFGGNDDHCRSWLRRENKRFNAKPIEMIKKLQGLVATLEYLDEMQD